MAPTPVFFPGESHGWRSLVGCSPWGRTESDTTEATWQKKNVKYKNEKSKYSTESKTTMDLIHTQKITWQ